MNKEDLGFLVLFSEAEIQEKIQDMSRKISIDYQDKELVLIGVLKGGFMFLSDLVKGLSFLAEVDFVETYSYTGTKSTGVVKITKELKGSVKNKHVILVDDIIDTGETMNVLIDHIQQKDPKSIKVATMLVKKSKHKMKYPVDYFCFEIEDDFVIGYGMDLDDKYRNLSSIQIYNSK